MSMEVRITLVFNALMIVGAISMWLTPLLSRRGIFFGVTVSPEFHETADAKRILWDYRKLTFGGTVIAMAGLWAAVPFARGMLWLIMFFGSWLVQFAAAVAAFASANNRVRPFSKPQRRSRTASLEPRTRTLPGGWIPLVAPMILVIVASLLLFARRHAMTPEAFRGSFSSLLVPFFLDALTIVIAYLGVYRTRQIHTSDVESRKDNRFRLGYFSLLVFAYFSTLFQIGMAFLTLKPLNPETGVAVFIMIVVLALGLMTFALTSQFSAAHRLPLAGDSADVALGDSTPDECWKWGIVYYNRDDPAFLVEKRVGFGWTLNYGNKWSWVLSFGLLAAPFVIRFFWFR
jgi:uncharacterized membrane protein